MTARRQTRRTAKKRQGGRNNNNDDNGQNIPVNEQIRQANEWMDKVAQLLEQEGVMDRYVEVSPPGNWNLDDAEAMQQAKDEYTRWRARYDNLTREVYSEFHKHSRRADERGDEDRQHELVEKYHDAIAKVNQDWTDLVKKERRRRREERQRQQQQQQGGTRKNRQKKRKTHKRRTA
jgi:hypothetical protein